MAGGIQKRGGRSNRRSARTMSEINVTPFVDVMLVLLIVFMVAAPLLTAGVKIDLPDSQAKAITSEDKKPLEITLDKNGVIYVGETQVKEARLVVLLRSITNNDAEKRIYIRADQTLDYGQVMRVLGMVNGAGYRKVALLSNRSAQ